MECGRAPAAEDQGKREGVEESPPEDYMADLSAFVVAEPQRGSRSRPRHSAEDLTGPKGPWQERRKQKALSRKEQAMQARQREEELLKMGLAAPIDSSNVGFRMLQKMGFRPRLIPSQSPSSACDMPGVVAETGMQAPVAIELKRNRLGLGRADLEAKERDKRRRAEQEAEEARALAESLRRDEFNGLLKGKWETERLRRNFRKAAGVVVHLEETRKDASSGDRADTLPGMVRSVLAAAVMQQHGDVLRAGEGNDDGRQAVAATREGSDITCQPHRAGMRNPGGLQAVGGRWGEDLSDDPEYDAQLICLARYPLDQGRPLLQELGSEAGDHAGGLASLEELAQSATMKDLEELLDWLRQQHSYCVFCGHQYPNLEALETACPGKEEDCH